MKSYIRQKLSALFPQLDPNYFVQRLRGRPPAEVFEGVYKNKVWGGRLSPGYHSGTGSRNAAVVAPYVHAVSVYLGDLERGPYTIVDVGCGDFYVGWRLVNQASTTNRWICCDIFPDLIESNTRKYKSSNVEFRVVDAIEDDLPQGNILIIRQVLQHLSNTHIAKIIPKMRAYERAIITEHLPRGVFTPNRDKETGPDHRVSFNSGVVLTAAPFNLSPSSAQVICEVESEGGLIRTTAYTL